MAVAYLNEECGLPVRMCSGRGRDAGAAAQEPLPQVHDPADRLGALRLEPHHQGDAAHDRGPRRRADQDRPGGQAGRRRPARWRRRWPSTSRRSAACPRPTCSAPPNHQGLYSIEESVQKMFLSFNAAFKFRVPVAIKVAASATSVSVFNNLVRDPYNIVGGFFLDGIDGGTGAAHEVSLDHTGHPIVSKLRDCYLAAVDPGAPGADPPVGRRRPRQDRRSGGGRLQDDLPGGQRRLHRQADPADGRLRRQRHGALQRLQHRALPGGDHHPGAGRWPTASTRRRWRRTSSTTSWPWTRS